MKLYTKTGDDGTTGLFGGARVPKHGDRVEAYGSVDEVNSLLGLARAVGVGEAIDQSLARIQTELFVLGAELACVPGKEAKMKMALIDPSHIKALEADIDTAEDVNEPLTSFVLPGGSLPAAHLHHTRTVCRRAERAVLRVADTEPVRAELIHYLNRLSDLLFALARRANVEAGVADVPWEPR